MSVSLIHNWLLSKGCREPKYYFGIGVQQLSGCVTTLLIMKITGLNACGAYCDDCPSYRGKKDPTCAGCTQTQGNPWWGECKLFKCSLEKNVAHCGLCDDFPCDLSATHFDPDNPIGQRNAIVRIGVLAYRAKHGDEKALELVEKLRTLKS